MRRVGMLAIALLVAGCDRVTDDMARQPRTDRNASSTLFSDGLATRAPPGGAIPHAAGDRAMWSSGRDGRLVAAAAVAPTADAALLARGAARYAIYCLPCHGAQGAGDGEVVRRGFPAPPSFAVAALRSAGDAELHDVIRHGRGAMAPFADRVSDADAWAIVTYLRTLQNTPMSAPMNAGSAPR